MALYKWSTKLAWIYPKPYAGMQVTLLSDWRNSSTQTVSAPWVDATKSVIISPDYESLEDSFTYKVYCSSQWENSLTFSCSEDYSPDTNLVMNVIVLW